MEIFRTEKRNFPDILAKRVSYHLENSAFIRGIEGIGTGINEAIDFFDKCLSEKEGHDVE